MTCLQLFLREWDDCRRCSLHHGREHLVFARGDVPCDVLFCGEAPGESEDVIGQPFVGPAGHLLDSIVARSMPVEEGNDGELPQFKVRLRCAFTNLVCCIPRDEDGIGKATEPPDGAIKACQPRLRQFIELCEPKLIVTVGNLARDWLDPKRRGSLSLPGIKQVHIEHPAAILRSPAVGQQLKIQRCVVTLANAVEGL